MHIDWQRNLARLSQARILKAQVQSEAQTAQFARALAVWLSAQLTPSDSFVMELEGDPGAGKTTFARYLLHALGVQGSVKSPTYAIVHTYEAGALAIAHFDFYRFAHPHEWEAAGLRDLFVAPGLKIVEWAGKVRPALAPPQLRIALAHGGGEVQREILIEYLEARVR